MSFTKKGANVMTKIADATHKPKISFIRNSIGICFKCNDGGVAQYGNTAKESYEALCKLRAKQASY